MTQRELDARDDQTLAAITHTNVDETVFQDVDGAEEIRLKIEQTRTEMSSTIDAIQEKLNPEHIKEQVVEATKEQAEHLKEQAVEAVREATIGKVEHAVENVRQATVGRAERFMDDANVATKGVSGGVIDIIRSNPIPAAIAGLSIGYLIMKGRNTSKNQPGGYNTQPHTGVTSASRYPTGQMRYADDDYYGRRSQYDQGYNQAPYARNYPTQQESGGFGDVIGKAGDTVSGVAGKAGDAVGSVVGTAGDVIGGVAGKTGDVVGGAVGMTGNVVGGAVGMTGNVVGGAVGLTGDVVGTVAHAVGDTVGGVGERIGTVREELPYQTQLLGFRIQDLLEENPMVVGAVAVALGAAVGFLVPETQQEQRLLGDTRDQMVNTISDKAQATVQNTVTKVQQVVQEVGHTAEKEAKRQGIMPQDQSASNGQQPTSAQ